MLVITIIKTSVSLIEIGKYDRSIHGSVHTWIHTSIHGLFSPPLILHFPQNFLIAEVLIEKFGFSVYNLKSLGYILAFDPVCGFGLRHHVNKLST